ncbi:MAG: hypothetical protein ACK53Y_08490 [bacterium]|jgi:hypothetical protein
MDGEPSSNVVSCRALLAKYLKEFSNVSAWWYPILANIENSLASFLGLDYDLRYLPLLKKCGLVKVNRIGSGKLLHGISMSTTHKGYSWTSFIAEYGLEHIEVTESYIKERN